MNGNYEQYQSIDDVDIIDDGFGLTGGALSRGQATASSLPFSRGRIAQKMEIAYELSNARAILARQALQNIATLSKEEEMLSQIAPAGSQRYKAIVDAATMADAILISQTRW